MTPQLRIGDAEREQAQAALGEHYAAGRLDHDEYSERLDRIWAARTRAELDPLFADLPGLDRARPPVTTWPAARHRPGRRLPAPLLVLLVVLGAIAVLTHLPVVLVGLALWFFLVRGGCRPHPRRW